MQNFSFTFGFRLLFITLEPLEPKASYLVCQSRTLPGAIVVGGRVAYWSLGATAVASFNML